MPAEVDAPSQSLFSKCPSFLNPKTKQERQPPASFEDQGYRRQHARSSSFGGFVSRILPSRREECGHTLRAHFRDDGSQDATDLVFNTLKTLELDKFNRTVSDSALGTRRRSCSPLLVGGEPSRRNPPPGARPERSGNDPRTGISRGSQKSTPFGRLLGLRKELDRDEGTHPHNPYTTARQAQKEVEVPVVLEGEKKPFLDVDVELSKAKRMFEDKKARREQRRSLKDSGDFLGVQGANPRTGYWDTSTGTSSSDPSQVNEEAKKRLDQEAREVAERKRRLAEAQFRHQLELQRVQALKDQRKAEKKKLEIKARQRRHGKWKHSENGWSSVAEPDLSPIVQSLAGSPTRETSPSDRLFPMPSAAAPTPYANQKNMEQGDYFGNRNSLPLEPNYSSLGNRSGPSRTMSIARKPVGSPSSRQNSAVHKVHSQRDYSTLETGSDNRLPIAPAVSSRDELHKLEPIAADKNIPLTPSVPAVQSKSPNCVPQPESFLDRPRVPSEVGDPSIRKAIATSYRSASTSQVMACRLLARSHGQAHRFSNPQQRTFSLKDFPPISLKDPITARMPSSCLSNPHVVWAPPTIRKPDPVKPTSSTTTSTTIITGYDHPRRPSIQLEGPDEIMTHSPSDRQPQQSSSAQVPSRKKFQQNQKLKDMHSSTFQVHAADIVTLSEHQLSPTKNRIARLCQTGSLEREVQSKSTLTYTSMSPRAPEKISYGACNAALVAFQNSRQMAATQKTKMQDSNRLTTPKTREGPGDTEYRFKSHDEENVYRKSVIIGPKVGWNKDRQDGLVVWRLSPNKKERVLQLQQNKVLSPDQICCPPPNITQLYARGETAEVVSPIKKAPRPGTPQPSVRQVMMRVVQTSWWFVEPVFDPHSALRERWKQGRLTWRDKGVALAAVLFLAIGLKMTAGIIKIIGVVFHTLKGFMELSRLIITGSGS